MTPQTFSLEMSRLLSSLAPGFEGHSVYVHGFGRNGKERINVVCRVGELQWLGYAEKDIICPAWQVEDVLVHLREIAPLAPGLKDEPIGIEKGRGHIMVLLTNSAPGTAYQKIEEYLWAVLKQPKDKACTKAHCKCIQTDCLNHHYVDDK